MFSESKLTLAVLFRWAAASHSNSSLADRSRHARYGMLGFNILIAAFRALYMLELILPFIMSNVVAGHTASSRDDFL